MASGNTIVQDKADVIRFVRFCPWHLSRPGPDLDVWIRKNVPRGIGLTERHISRVPDADVRNTRYARTLDAVGKARFRRSKVFVLLHNLVREGETAIAWKRDGEADRYSDEREAEALFLRHRISALRAAETLSRVFANTSHAARWTADIAFMRGMEEVPLSPEHQIEGEEVSTGTAWPFERWRVPPTVGGNVRAAHHLVALMTRLATELRADHRGGHHQSRFGPFIYPAGVAPPRESANLLLNGLLYVAVRAARKASGGRPCLDVGAPMPDGGESHYSLAAAFVADVTSAIHSRGSGTILTAEEARQRLTKFLNRSPGVMCCGWAADRDR